MSDPTISGTGEQQPDAAARDYVAARARAGAPSKAIVEELIQRGYDPAAAQSLVGGVAGKQAQSTRTSGLWLLIGGLAITALSIGLTISSYAAAAEQGGTYVICWGAAIFGLILAVRGLRQLLSGREVK